MPSSKYVPLLCWLDHSVKIEVDHDMNTGNTAMLIECQDCGYTRAESS
jgi:hypothetical protein